VADLTRRGFLAFLGALPLVGLFVRERPPVVVDERLTDREDWFLEPAPSVNRDWPEVSGIGSYTRVEHDGSFGGGVWGTTDRPISMITYSPLSEEQQRKWVESLRRHWPHG
jgi:hypothetical protein